MSTSTTTNLGLILDNADEPVKTHHRHANENLATLDVTIKSLQDAMDNAKALLGQLGIDAEDHYAVDAETARTTLGVPSLSDIGDIVRQNIPLMSPTTLGGAKLEEHGGLVLRDEKLGIGSLVQESDGAMRGGIAGLTAEGHAEQDGTPTPDNPVPIEVVRGRNLCREAITIPQSGQYSVALVCDIPELLPSTNYILSFDGAAGNKLYTNEKISIQQTFTVPSDGHVVVEFTTKNTLPSNEQISEQMYSGWRFLKNYADNTVMPSFSNVQLTLGSTPQPYVPYGHVGLEVRGVHEETALDRVVLDNGIYYTDTGTITEIFKVEPNHTYTLHRNGGNRTRISEYASYPQVGDSGTMLYASNGEVKTVQITPTKSYIAVYLSSDATTLPIAYAELVLTTTPIPLPPRGWVGSLPDGTADVLTLDGAGKVTWEEKTAEYTITTTDTLHNQGFLWQTNAPNAFFFRYSISEGVFQHGLSGYSNKHKWYASNLLNTFSASEIAGGTANGMYAFALGNDASVYFNVPNVTTKEQVDSWLSTNPVTALYPLATPVIEDCGYVNPPSIEGDCTISIPELDALGVKYFVDDSAGTLARQWYERAQSEYADRITTLEQAVAELATS